MTEQEFVEDSETVDETELFVERDSEGELLPVSEEAPGIGNVRVLPMVYGKVREYFGSNRQMDDISSSEIAEILRNHVVEPDLSNVTEDEVDNKMKMMAPQSLLIAVLKASGVDVDLDSVEQGEPVLQEGN